MNVRCPLDLPYARRDRWWTAYKNGDWRCLLCSGVVRPEHTAHKPVPDERAAAWRLGGIRAE